MLQPWTERRFGSRRDLDILHEWLKQTSEIKKPLVTI
jgi:hypothetical protein